MEPRIRIAMTPHAPEKHGKMKDDGIIGGPGSLSTGSRPDFRPPCFPHGPPWCCSLHDGPILRRRKLLARTQPARLNERNHSSFAPRSGVERAGKLDGN